MPSNAIWTPQGVVPLDGAKKIDRIELRAALGEWLRQFSDFASAQGLGMHCSHCGGDVVGRNADSDATFSVTCGCREWVFNNRDYLKAPVQ